MCSPPAPQVSWGSPQSKSALVRVKQKIGFERKRVRFVEDETSWLESCSSSVRAASSLPLYIEKRSRTMDNIPSYCGMNEEDKARLWFRAMEFEALRQERVNDANQSLRKDNDMILLGLPYFCFNETLATIFAVCKASADDDDYVDNKTKDENVISLPPEIVTFMATDEARGLESQTAPQVAIERRLLRAHQKKSVLRAQHAFSSFSKYDLEERIRKVSRKWSKPSRKLAEALGIIDAKAAALVFRRDDDKIRISTVAKNNGLV